MRAERPPDAGQMLFHHVEWKGIVSRSHGRMRREDRRFPDGVEGCVETVATLDEIMDLPADFVPKIVARMREAGLTLQSGQLYGFRVPPSAGGEYSPDNLQPMDIQAHFREFNIPLDDGEEVIEVVGNAARQYA